MISREDILVLERLLLEFVHVSTLGSAHDSEVRSERNLVLLLVKNLAVGDISH